MKILNIEMRNSSAELVFLLTKHDLPLFEGQIGRQQAPYLGRVPNPAWRRMLYVYISGYRRYSSVFES